MSQFETKCPHCGTTLSVQEEWIGMNVECPECQKSFKISSPDTNEEKSSPPSFQGVQPPSSTPPQFQGVQPPSSTPPPFQGVPPQSSTPPPFQGVPPQSSTPPAFQGVKTSSSPYMNEINTYVKQKLDLYIGAMDVALFLFVALCPLVCIFYDKIGDEIKEDTKLFLLCILMSLTIGCFWAAVGIEGYLLWETIRAIPEKRRRQHPVASAILLLIPGWCVIWNFFTLPRTATELNDEILRMGKEGPKKLYWAATAYCIFTVIMILLAVTAPVVIKESGSSAGMWGSILSLYVMMFCLIAFQHGTFSAFAEAVAIIKSEEAE